HEAKPRSVEGLLGIIAHGNDEPDSAGHAEEVRRAGITGDARGDPQGIGTMYLGGSRSRPFSNSAKHASMAGIAAARSISSATSCPGQNDCFANHGVILSKAASMRSGAAA